MYETTCIGTCMVFTGPSRSTTPQPPFQSGLTEACLNSPHTKDDVSKAILAYVKKWIPSQRVGVLAGNSVHADRSFLVEEMPEVIDWLHYRSISFSYVMDHSLANVF